MNKVLQAIITLLIVLIAVLTAFGSITDNPVTSELTARIYVDKTEVIEVTYAYGFIRTEHVLYTLYDPAYHGGIYCALTVVNENGHTCITSDDKYEYTPNIFQDSDSYWEG